jgi:hypothetical protein
MGPVVGGPPGALVLTDLSVQMRGHTRVWEQTIRACARIGVLLVAVVLAASVDRGDEGT